MINNNFFKFEKLESTLKKFGLTNLGIIFFNNKFLKKYENVILIGPDEPFFWDIFKNSKEFKTLNKNPLDTWSKRIIDKISKEFSGKAFYPFQKKPIIPFYQWALMSDKIWESPVKLLVHENRGLMVSFRGAIAFENKIIRKEMKKKTSPCLSCNAPCQKSCPVNAISSDRYDISHCLNFINNSDENNCTNGCLVRRSCPLGQSLRKTEQSKYHMTYFINQEKK